MSDKLLPCPCGEIPSGVGVTSAGQGGKWAWVNGDCCGVWCIEFRTDYNALDSSECLELAVEAWNEALRANK